MERRGEEARREGEEKIPETNLEVEEENRRRVDGYNPAAECVRMPYNTRTRAGKVITRPKHYDEYVNF